MDKILKKVIDKLPDKIKSTETAQRLSSETSDYFKPIKKAGGWMVVAGASAKTIMWLLTLTTPITAPAGFAGITSSLIEWGALLWVNNKLTNKK